MKAGEVEQHGLGRRLVGDVQGGDGANDSQGRWRPSRWGRRCPPASHAGTQRAGEGDDAVEAGDAVEEDAAIGAGQPARPGGDREDDEQIA